MPTPSLSRAQIVARASAQSFARGEGYFRDGAVVATTRQGDTLRAEVEGSDYRPYEITVTLDRVGIVAASCTCPYDWGGDCKHIVAVLLTFLDDPDAFEPLPTVAELLDGLDPEALRALLEQATAEVAGFNQWLLAAVPGVRRAAPPTPQAASPRRTPLDPAPFERQMRALLRVGSRYDEYGHMDAGATLRPFLAQVEGFLAQGDGGSALVILRVIYDQTVPNYEMLEGESEMADFLAAEAGPLLAEAFLSTDITPKEQQEWEERIEQWHTDLEEYGVDYAFDLPMEALEWGWDEMDGDDEAWDSEEGATSRSWYAFIPTLADVKLQVLERTGRTEEFLAQAAALGQHRRRALKLLELGRSTEAIEAARPIHSADDALAVAQALRAAGHLEAAAAIAAQGLGEERHQMALGQWLGPVAAELGQHDLARRAWRSAYSAQPNRAAFEALRDLMPAAEWPALRATLLDEAEQKGAGGGDAAEVLIAAGEIDRAISLAEKQPNNYRLLEVVVTAATPTHPHWVIDVTRRQAEALIDSVQSKHYPTAAHWLEKTKAAHRAAGTIQEWVAYLRALKERHARKRALIPLLNRL